jgi:uncharacterized membrane protein YebE (DUF533 family)
MGDNLKFFKEGLDYAKKVIPELKTAILKDKYQTELSQVGGLIGLVGIGYEIYARWRTSKQTYAERAIDSLIKCVFAASHETLKEIRRVSGFA